MFHCVSFRHNKTLFLFDNLAFRHRFIKLGYCPKCRKTIIELHEERKADGKKFVEVKAGIEAINFLAKIATNINYTDEIKRDRNLPIGWKYGVNIQLKDGTVRQYASDFNNNKELIKTISNR